MYNQGYPYSHGIPGQVHENQNVTLNQHSLLGLNQSNGGFNHGGDLARQWDGQGNMLWPSPQFTGFERHVDAGQPQSSHSYQNGFHAGQAQQHSHPYTLSVTRDLSLSQPGSTESWVPAPFPQDHTNQSPQIISQTLGSVNIRSQQPGQPLPNQDHSYSDAMQQNIDFAVMPSPYQSQLHFNSAPSHSTLQPPDIIPSKTETEQTQRSSTLAPRKQVPPLLKNGVIAAIKAEIDRKRKAMAAAAEAAAVAPVSLPAGLQPSSQDHAPPLPPPDLYLGPDRFQNSTPPLPPLPPQANMPTSVSAAPEPPLPEEHPWPPDMPAGPQQAFAQPYPPANSQQQQSTEMQQHQGYMQQAIPWQQYQYQQQQQQCPAGYQNLHHQQQQQYAAGYPNVQQQQQQQQQQYQPAHQQQHTGWMANQQYNPAANVALYNQQYMGAAYSAPPYPGVHINQHQQSMTSLAPSSTVLTAPGREEAAAAAVAVLKAKHVVIDARKLIKAPGRDSRPKRILIILRGLPGSGKSHIAKLVRELEAEFYAASSASAVGSSQPPRVLSLDEYFFTEVEKEVLDDDLSCAPSTSAPSFGRARGSSASLGSKKKKVIELEYVYDAEMEGTYQRSLVKAATKALEEGRSAFLIVDAPNIKLEDFKELWGTAQRCHYEPYVQRPTESDPSTCHARNTHGRTLEDIKAAAAAWEEPSVLYTMIDFGPLLRNLAGEDHIQEVDMGDEEEVQVDVGKGPAGEDQNASLHTLDIGRAQHSTSAVTATGEDYDKGDDDDDDEGVERGMESSSWHATSASSAAVSSSRWSTSDVHEEQQSEAGSNRSKWKRRRGDDNIGASRSIRGKPLSGGAISAADLELLKELDDDLEAAGEKSASEMGGESSALLREAVEAQKKRLKKMRRVWWPDQEPDTVGDKEGLGFLLRTSKPLVEVHYVDGLGPAKGDTAMQYMLAPGGTLAPGGLAAGRFIPGLPRLYPTQQAGSTFEEQVRAEHNSEHALLLKGGQPLFEEEEEDHA
ncbi:hypothetical protein CEUSTIGMA_g6000.t1 [Chlamydomonas eustigma]|uniref:YLP motif-containing protein 1 n=1 Tax=Chlamydomonas eustigma TaxID=1157962 RepID=A0A250X729_9CHLO|nr:hypothetical protein CEUSTIGMA_g6000.t1 [Chlamydomonas eustigma]|eukprot:GAX78560.1 hypothetical protein CEUSTIGMA_g6000.t1 [Chlamydomonas eustigma]